MRKVKYILSGRLLPCAALLLCFFAGCVYFAFKLPFLLAPAAALERILSLSAAVFLYASRLAPEKKARKLLLLLLLPWLGLFFCLPKRKPPQKADGSACCRPFLEGLPNAVSTLAWRGCKLGGCRAASAEYFPTGKEMFSRLLCDLESAETEILLEYYIIERGKFFDAIFAVLEKKAGTGVDVRLVYDDFGCATTLPRGFAEEMRRRGIQTSVYHPVRAFPLRKLNRRDHRKLVVIDRRIAYTGGINLADEYIGEKIRFGHWKDTAARLEGEPAERFAALFFQKPSLKTSKPGSPCVVFGDATRDARVGEEIFFRLIGASQTALHFCTPYLSPTEKIRSALRAAAASGADVRILIPHIPDRKAVFALTRSYARRLESDGVKVREYAAGFLHAKSLIADGKHAFIGSYNLDGRSLLLQAECGVYLQDEKFCAAAERDFSACWEAGLPVPKATFPEKLCAFVLRLFSPLV